MKWQEYEFFDRVCQRNQLVFPELRVFGRILARRTVTCDSGRVPVRPFRLKCRSVASVCSQASGR